MAVILHEGMNYRKETKNITLFEMQMVELISDGRKQGSRKQQMSAIFPHFPFAFSQQLDDDEAGTMTCTRLALLTCANLNEATNENDHQHCPRR